MNQFIFYLEFIPHPGVPTARMVGTLQARDGAAARKVLETYVEEVRREYHSDVSPTILRMEIHGVMSRHFQINRL